MVDVSVRVEPHEIPGCDFGRRVRVALSTHDEGGLTQKDVDGAAMADAVASSLPHLEEFGDG